MEQLSKQAQSDLACALIELGKEVKNLCQENAELEKENEFLKEENFSLMLKISRQKSPKVKAKIIAKSLGIKTTGGE